MIEIDGSFGEGGGQILRTALSMSCALGVPVAVKRIRAKRPNPGLAPQHLAVCRLLSSVCNAKLEGARIGSSEVRFYPQKADGGSYKLSIGTAGSCTLLLQAVLPALLSSQSDFSVEVEGGTHVAHSPPFDYFSEVFLPALSRFGIRASAQMAKPGFYPKGGGVVSLSCKACSSISAASFAGPPKPVFYAICSSLLPKEVAKQEEEEIKREFPGCTGKAVGFSSLSKGNCVCIWSGFHGSSCLLERGMGAKQVAQAAAAGLKKSLSSGAEVDCHLADQLLPFACLAKGKTEFSAESITEHTLSNAHVLRSITGRNIIISEGGKIIVE